MASLTVLIDDELLRSAELHAARRGTTLDGLVRDHLEEVTGFRSEPVHGRDLLIRLSRGEIGRQDAQDALGVDYGTLLVRLTERGLAVPSLSADEIERQADVFARVWRGAGPA